MAVNWDEFTPVDPATPKAKAGGGVDWSQFEPAKEPGIVDTAKRAARDTGAAALISPISFASGLFGLADMATGGGLDRASTALTGESMSSRFNRAHEIAGHALYSDKMLAKQQELDSIMKDKDGSGGALPAVGYVLSNPDLFATILAESLAPMAGMGAATNVAARSAQAAKLKEFGGKFESIAQAVEAKAMTQAEATAVATQGLVRGERANLAVNYAAEAGDTAMQSKQYVMDMKIEDLRNSPDFQRLAKEYGEDEARLRLAERAEFVGGFIAGLIGMGASKVTGTAKLEAKWFGGKAVAGATDAAPQGMIAKAMATPVGKAVGSTGREFTEEFIQGAGDQIGQNVGVIAGADPNQSITQGALAQAAVGGLAGAAFGLGGHLVFNHDARPASPLEQRKAAADQRTADGITAINQAPDVDTAVAAALATVNAAPPVDLPVVPAAAVAASGGLFRTINPAAPLENPDPARYDPAYGPDGKLTGWTERAPIVGTTTATVNGKQSTKVTRRDGSVEINGTQVTPPAATTSATPLSPPLVKVDNPQFEPGQVWQKGRMNFRVVSISEGGKLAQIDQGGDQASAHIDAEIANGWKLATQSTEATATPTEPPAAAPSLVPEGWTSAKVPSGILHTGPDRQVIQERDIGGGKSVFFSWLKGTASTDAPQEMGSASTLDEAKALFTGSPKPEAAPAGAPAEKAQPVAAGQDDGIANGIAAAIADPANQPLPKQLAAANPRYNFGDKAFTLKFESDADKSAYIAAQDKPSKRDADYVAFASKALGLNEFEVRAHGRAVRDAIKGMAMGSAPGELTVPKQSRTAPVDVAAHTAATSPKNDLPQPTEAQKEAGTYKKGHTVINGVDVSIENPAGSKRNPKWPTLKGHYGYVKGVPARAPDKEHVDVFVKPGTPADWDGDVVVIDQNHADGKFDEPKVMIGYDSLDEGYQAYLDNYTKGWESRVRMTTPMSMGEFRAKLQDKNAFMKPQPAPKVQRERSPAQLANDAKKAREAAARKRIDLNNDTLIQSIIKRGGINLKNRKEILGEDKGNRNIAFVGHLFTSDGRGFDTFAEELARDGYLTPQEMEDGGTQALTDLIRAEFRGAPARMSGAQDIEHAASSADQEEEDIRIAAEQYGIPTDGLTFADIKAAVIAKMDQDAALVETEADKEARLEREAMQSDNLVPEDSYYGDDPGFDQSSFSQSQAATDRSDAAAGQGNVDQDPAEVAGGPQSDAQADSSAGSERQEASRPVLDLAGQTAAEGRATAERVAAEGAAKAKADAKAEADEKQKRIDAEIASRQSASAENFQLGQSAEDSLAGQGDVLSQPVSGDSNKSDTATDDKERAKNLLSGRGGLLETDAEKAKRESGGIERYQWMRNEQGGQKFGNRMTIQPVTKELFDEWVKPRTKGVTWATFSKDKGATHISLVERDDGKTVTGVPFIGTLDELRPGKNSEAVSRGWVVRVDSFTSTEAIKQGETADSDAAPVDTERAARTGAALENGTAPEHITGVDDRELSAIVEEFNAAQRAEVADGERVTRIFDDPAKGDVVRLADKAKVYHKDHGWMSVADAKAQIEEWKKHAQAQGENSQENGNANKVVLSLFDLSGEWSRPWEEAGYQVYRFDIQDAPKPEEASWADPASPDYDENLAKSQDIHHFGTEFFNDVYGSFDGMDIHAILAACPCTDFASSGARHFAAKDADGRTVASVKLVQQTIATIEYFKPAVWAVENPVGRIEKLTGMPPWRLSFDPNHLGEPYTKKTLLWGRFNGDLPVAPVEPTEGSKMWSQYGGKSQATKNARSVTPEGFSYAFFMANNAVDHPAMALANKFDMLDRKLIAKALDAGISEADITEAVEDHYYQDLDYAAANKAVRDLIGDKPTPKKTTKAAKPASEMSAADLLRAAADKMDAPAAENPTPKPTPATPTAEINPLKGDRFTDANGDTYEVWSTRHDHIEAFPVVDGKVVVNRDNAEFWALTPAAQARYPDARTDYTPIAKKKKPVTPQLMTRDPESYIKVAADSIGELRKADVYRVLIESNQAAFRADIARYIKENRPDLAAEVDAVMAEAEEARNNPAPANPDQAKIDQADADFDAAMGDLGDILGPTRLNLTPEQEQKILPVLTRLFDAAFRKGYYKFKDAARFVLNAIRSKFGDELTDEITLDHLQGAYIGMAGRYKDQGADKASAVVAVESKAEFEEDSSNVNDQRGSTDLERDSQDANAENGVGAQSLPDGRPGDSRGGESGISNIEAQVRAGSVDGLSGPEAPPTGERGDQPVRTGTSGGADVSAGSGFLERGDSGSLFGSPIESDSAAVTQGLAQSRPDLARQQAEADKKAHKPGIENIREVLPILKAGQQDDVHTAETRFAKTDGYGMLFTNGTGTGKTFTGLGIVKRFAVAGKNNIIITVPTDKIADDWIKTARLFGLQVSLLENTSSSGNGIVVTTYANFGSNPSLAKRDWDLVINDEAHYLSANANGDVTRSQKTLQALTMHPDGVYTRAAMLHEKEYAELKDLQALAKSQRTSDDERSWHDAGATQKKIDALLEDINANAGATQKKIDALLEDINAKVKVIQADVASKQGLARPRALFLSATPFAYEKTVDWANGYLFDYNEGRGDERGETRGYNAGSNHDQFFMQHFGYRMRYGKLTEPDSKVDRGLMQRQFNSWLKKNGVLAGRMLDVEADYDRRFVLTESAIGARIDEALEWFHNQRQDTADEARRTALYAVDEAINDKFDYLSRRFLLEAIKAKEVIAHVKEHMAVGRKVVVFHDYNKGGGFNPFDLNNGSIPGSDESSAVDQVIADFREEFKDIIDSEVWRASSPIATFQNAFPNVLLVNGLVPKNARRANIEKFQDDASGPQVILVQSDAGKEGISLHDTTGKHQRALFNLGQPTKPTQAIQIEGRIYRTGQVTDAIFRYLNTGTNWEKWAFATTIAQRASAAENLAVGEQARALKDAFIAGFEESDDYRAGMENEGKGGKERDKAANAALTEYDRARSFYFGTQKKTSKTKAQEGADYFATPEPVGLKMMEFANIRPGESVLEPSAGHGAIARWAPETVVKTAIEPSSVLRSRLAMVFDGKILDHDFENLDVHNKYDAIVMNPPFGSAGRTAIDHLAKAATHLRDGGRIVALIPRGSTDAKFDKWFYEETKVPVKPLFTSPEHGEIFRGDILKFDAFGQTTEMTVWNIDTPTQSGASYARPKGVDFSNAINLSALAGVARTGPRTRTEKQAEGLYLVADINLPSVTFERAGTTVSARIVVLEKSADAPQQTSRDLTDVEDINTLFDRMENMTLRDRAKPVEVEAEAPAARPGRAGRPAAPVVDQEAAQAAAAAEGLEIITHTTGKGKVLRGVVRMGITLDEAKKIDKFTFRKNGGYFIREKHLAPPAVEQRSAKYGAPTPNQIELFYDDTETRPGTTDVQRRVGIAALKGLFAPDRAAGATLLGSRLWADFQERAGSDLIGQTARSPRELGLLAQILRDPRFETMRVFFTKGSKIVGHTGWTSRLPGAVAFGLNSQSQNNQANYEARIGSLKAQMSSLGADGYFMLHNHPSGSAKPSKADVRVTVDVASKLAGFKGHVVIDHNEFGSISDAGNIRVSPMMPDEPGYMNSAKTPELAHDALGMRADNPVSMAEIGRLLQRKAGYVTLISTDGPGRVTAIAEVPESQLSFDQKGRTIARIRRFMRMTGSASHAFILGDNPRRYDWLMKRNELTDALSADGNESRAQLIGAGSTGRPAHSRILAVNQEGSDYQLTNPTPQELKDREKAQIAAAEQKAKDEAKADAIARGKPLVGEQVDLFNTQDSLFSRQSENIGQFKFQTGEDKQGRPVFANAEVGLALAERDPISRGDGVWSHKFSIRARQLDGTWKAAGRLYADLDRNGKFLALRGIDIIKEFRQNGTGYGESVVASMLAHNGTTPMQIRDIQHHTGDPATDALPFWEKLGTRTYNDSNDPAVEINGVLTLAAYLRARGEGSRLKRNETDQSTAEVSTASTGRGGARSSDPGSNGRGQRGNDAGATGDRSGNVGASGQDRSPSAVARLAGIRRIVSQITAKWENAPPVQVLTGMDDPRVPAAVRAEYDKQQQGGAVGAPEAFYHGGSIYILADAMGNPDRAAVAVFHEALGHFGLRGVFGQKLDSILDRVIADHGDMVRAKARQYGLDPAKKAELRQAAEEILAELAQTRPELGIINRLVAMVREFLRELGVNIRLSRADVIANFILPARGFVEGGKQGITFKAAEAFSRPSQGFIDVQDEWNKYDDSGESTMQDLVAALDGLLENVDLPGNTDALEEAVRVWQEEKRYDTELAGRGDMAEADRAVEGAVKAYLNDARFSRAPQTDSAAFKKWFGNSKVVDANGEPLVVYHGTEKALTAFRAGTAWFSSSAEVAGGYAADRARAAVFGEIFNPGVKAGSPTVYPVVLSIRNPKVVDLKGANKDPKWLNAQAAAAAKDGHDGIIFKNSVDVTSFSKAEASDVYAVFSPNQIKSVFNRGNFDASNPDVRFSRAADLFDAPPVAGSATTGDVRDSLTTRAMNVVSDVWASESKINLWNKTVGTMQHIALTNPEFKPTFDEGQAFLSDAVKFANEAKSLAPDLLPTIDSLKDFRKKSATTADVTAAGDALMAGTLDGGGSPTKGVRWTPAQLESGAGGKFVPLTASQATLYGQALDATKSAMENLAKSLINRIIKPYGIGFNREASISSVVTAINRQIDYNIEVRKDELYDVTQPETIEGEALNASDLAGGGKEGAIAADQVRQAAKNKAASLRGELRQLNGIRDSIQDIYKKTNDLTSHGYFPAMRFGRFAVSVVEGGKQVLFSMYETQTAANMARRSFIKEFPNATVGPVKILSKNQHELFQGLSLDAIETFADYITDENGKALSSDPLVQEFIRAATSERSVLKRHLHRKGIAGYSRDLPRVLSAFVTSSARATSSAYHMGEMTRLANEIKSGDVQHEAVELVKYLRDPQEEAQRIRGFLFFHFLGGSLASGLVNMTQPLLMTAPFLAKTTGWAKAMSLLGKAAVTNTDKLTGDAKIAFDRAHAEGIVSPQEIHQLRAQAGGAILSNNLTLRKLTHAWGLVFSLTEQLNRKTTFLAAYQIAKDQKMADPYAFAVDAVEQTQGIYNKGNRAVWGRGPVGSVVMTFKQFSVAYLEMAQRLYKTDKRAFSILMLTLLAGAGAEGMPFAEDLEDLIDTIGQWMGYATNSKKKLRQFAEGVLGKDMAKIALHGLSGVPFMPVDVSNRIGLANLIPGTAMFKPSEKNKARDVLEMVGPIGQFFPTEDTQMGKALDRLAASDWFGAVKSVAPIAVQNLAKGAEMGARGYAVDSKGKKVTATTGVDAVFKMAGLQPRVVADESRKIGEISQDIAIQKRTEGDIAEMWARGVADHDPAAVNEARIKMREWNQNNPELRVVISPGQIQSRVKQMRSSRVERTVKSTPKEMRGEVREALR